MTVDAPDGNRRGDGSRRLLVCGGSGLVGGQTLLRLAPGRGWDAVEVLSRRPLPALERWPGLRVHVVDFDHLDALRELFRVTHVVSALGTTRAQAGSAAERARVEQELPARVASLARAEGARCIVLVSSLGASPRSPSSYLRAKGNLEASVRRLCFPSATVLRPSLLSGERSPARPLERRLARLARFLPDPLRSIEAGTVAAAICHAALREEPGFRCLSGRAIRELAADR